jgi:cytochrome c oxidase subunit 3/cytochrome o ubiquinol oxidase subunit 3
MTSTIALTQTDWTLPDRGRVGLICLIATEFVLFTIFVVAYVFYIGKSLTGPTPAQVLELPVWPTFCLLSSSITVGLAAKAIKRGRMSNFQIWTAATVLLGIEFLRQTALEWRHLIEVDRLTITTNLFGTTFYSLVGLHASHVVLGLTLLTLVLVISTKGTAPRRQSVEESAEPLGGMLDTGPVLRASPKTLCGGMTGQARRFELLAWYWHFVDAVWVVVFTVVYVVGR